MHIHVHVFIPNGVCVRAHCLIIIYILLAKIKGQRRRKNQWRTNPPLFTLSSNRWKFIGCENIRIRISMNKSRVCKGLLIWKYAIYCIVIRYYLYIYTYVCMCLCVWVTGICIFLGTLKFNVLRKEFLPKKANMYAILLHEDYTLTLSTNYVLLQTCTSMIFVISSHLHSDYMSFHIFSSTPRHAPCSNHFSPRTISFGEEFEIIRVVSFNGILLARKKNECLSMPSPNDNL